MRCSGSLKSLNELTKTDNSGHLRFRINQYNNDIRPCGLVVTREEGMINISQKPVIYRRAVAVGKIQLGHDSISSIINGTNPKGDVLENAKLSAIQAVKKTPDLIFMCHPIPIEAVKTRFDVDESQGLVTVRVEVHASSKTGVEMEALTGVMAALLTLWDVCKRFEKDNAGNYPNTKILEVRVLEKEKRGID